MLNSGSGYSSASGLLPGKNLLWAPERLRPHNCGWASKGIAGRSMREERQGSFGQDPQTISNMTPSERSATDQTISAEVITMSLEELRMKDVKKIALNIAAETEQFALASQEITQESLKAVLKTVRALAWKIEAWVEPPSIIQTEPWNFVKYKKLPTEL
ncbi:hypothetical protein BDZ45DRAFT_675016 [Acephala macrosclerotiorum]|nr:hypothetical protein BDZ45DRAFT_675016 [Acephala macrosclerotiorum]